MKETENAKVKSITPNEGIPAKETNKSTHTPQSMHMQTHVKMGIRIPIKLRNYLDLEIDRARWASYNHAVVQLVSAAREKDSQKVRARVRNELQETLEDGTTGRE